MKFLVFASAVLAVSLGLVLPPRGLTGKALTEYVNSKQSLWKAGEQSISLEKVKARLMDARFVQPNKEEDIVEIHEQLDSLPTSFDSREQWPACTSLTNIRDQSDCGSCWAFAAAEAASDRFCIHSNATINTLLSAEDVLSCCTGCGYGCGGGFPIEAWRYLVKTGFCTGGSYEAQFGCKPYSLAPCSETVNNVTWPDCPEGGYDTPTCVNSCTNNNYSIEFKKDKYYGLSAYAVGKKVAQIQTEIYNNGPVEATFTVYEDFYQYTSGIYSHTAGDALGGHAVKIIGWGVEKGTPYWLIANSWNVNWGEQGYFRMLRGTNECGIEEGVTGGIPKV